MFFILRCAPVSQVFSISAFPMSWPSVLSAQQCLPILLPGWGCPCAREPLEWQHSIGPGSVWRLPSWELTPRGDTWAMVINQVWKIGIGCNLPLSELQAPYLLEVPSTNKGQLTARHLPAITMLIWIRDGIRIPQLMQQSSLMRSTWLTRAPG